MESLNEIFEEILHSEQDFTAKITELRNVNSLIEEAEKTYRDAKNMSESLYGKYLLKTQKMVDCNTSVLLAKTEYDSLTDQQQLLIKEEKELTRQCDEIKEEIDTTRLQFITVADEFSCDFDLYGNGLVNRKQKQEEKLQLLMKELSIVENESKLIQSQQKDIGKLLTELSILQSELKEEQDNNTYLQQKMDTLSQLATVLTQEKASLLDGNNNDDEFHRIQQELEICRSCPEEKDCIILRKQLQALQREQYKKQMKHRNNNVTDTSEQYSKDHSNTRVLGRQSDQQTKRSCIQQPVQSLHNSYEHEKFDHEIEFDEYDLASIEAVETMEEYNGVMSIDDNDDLLPRTTGNNVLPCDRVTGVSSGTGQMYNKRPIQVNRHIHNRHTASNSSAVQQCSRSSLSNAPLNLHHGARNNTSYQLQVPGQSIESDSGSQKEEHRPVPLSRSNQRYQMSLRNREQIQDGPKQQRPSNQSFKRVRFST